MPKFQLDGLIQFANGEIRMTVFSIEAENREEAKFFFSHGVHLNSVDGIPCDVNDAKIKIDLRTVKPQSIADQIFDAICSEYSMADNSFKYYDREANDILKGESYQVDCARKRDTYERERAVLSKIVRITEEILGGKE